MNNTTSTGQRREGASGVKPHTRLSDRDLHLFNEGTHLQLYDKLGAHPTSVDGRDGTYFAVWAPNAEQVSVIGDFNDWQRGAHPLYRAEQSGIWQGFVGGVGPGSHYKYCVRSRFRDFLVDKADPFGFRHERPPQTASIVWGLDYEWGDQGWMEQRAQSSSEREPMSVYEVHLGSWMRTGDQPDGQLLNYREIAPRLADYAVDMGFTHVELMPVMEHPFYGSWGYQCTGYFAPTARHGTPQDLMFMIDHLHQAGIGVILDWVPSHFPGDEHGLRFFDGTCLYEHADTRQGFHPDWKSFVFNYGRHEVRSFLASSAMFWLDRFHADGLRVDAVASMLHLDYSRPPGQWIPNRFGGRENLEAVDFLLTLNERVNERFEGVDIIAEESTAWPLVSRPTHMGGLGFGMKWDMGWMHDTLAYFGHDPIHRKHHHDALTFRSRYAFEENFVLPLSHDEVVHEKGSLLEKMPGDDWQKFANLRLLFAYMYAQPGKKLLFMGAEFAQRAEWNHDQALDWHLLEHTSHQGVHRLVAELNALYRQLPALHQRDFSPGGFEWIDAQDHDQSVLSFIRIGEDPQDLVVCVYNFTPVPRHNYRIGVDRKGKWDEILNTDAEAYWGSGVGNRGGVLAAPIPYHDRDYSLMLTLPPLGALYLRPQETS